MLSRVVAVAAAIAVPFLAAAEEKADLFSVNRIKSEAFENSKVMDHAFYLTDVYGGRLTGSPGYKGAADWAAKRLTSYGLTNVTLEPWGPFGRSWSFSHFRADLIEPQYAPLIGFPLAWSQGTNGKISGEPILAVIATEADMAKWKGKLKGRLVMLDRVRDLTPRSAPLYARYTDAELAERAMAPDPGAAPPQRAAAAADGLPPARTPEEIRARRETARRLRNKIQRFLIDEGAVLAIRSGRGEEGTVFGQQSGSYELKDPISIPSVGLTPEHYNRLARLLDKKVPVKVEVEYDATISSDSQDSVNVVGEIQGGRKKDEVVMLGAHLDSWHGATGATDNAAGVAVVMEAVRILKALDVKMDRTIRIALWGGEEEGLLGSKAYVRKHFADPEVMKPMAEHAKLDAYFNFDNGTGKIRGIYMQGNDMVRPIFEAWLAPFRDMGATTVTIRNTEGTDHLSFDNVGLPGFQFIQDEIEYDSRTHHSNMDLYDRLQKGDLMQASAILASFVYQTAMRDEMLPRKPLPKPQPPRRDTEPTPSSAKPATPTDGGSGN